LLIIPNGIGLLSAARHPPDVAGIHFAVDAVARASGHNDEVAGRTGRLLAFFARAEPRGAPASGWALALDAAVAVAAAAGAVYEVASRTYLTVSVRPSEMVKGPAGGYFLLPLGTAHASFARASLDVLIAAALTALPLAARRVYPVGAWLTIATAIMYVHPVYVPPVALGTGVYAAYSAITYSRHRNLAIAVVAVATLVVAGTLGNQLPRFPARLTAVVAIAAAAVAGLGIRVLRRRLADSTARLSRAADEARAATERALAAERARIASELHDVVTHNVSVMIVQAGAARKIMASSPADAEDALLAVEATGREAMTELRNLLGLLSPAGDGTDEGGGLGTGPGGDLIADLGADSGADSGAGGGACGGADSGAGGGADSGAGGGADSGAGGGAGHGVGPAGAPAAAALRPQPGLGELDALIRRVSAAGLPVTLAVRGEPWPLPPGAGLAAYRVAQEGLTNVLRHAGAASATVAVDWGDSLRITVDDDGHGGPGGMGGAGGAGPGRGLLGLRERLALYGGELAAGPRPGREGGWRVRAVLPLTGPALPGAGGGTGAGADGDAAADGAGDGGAGAGAGAPEASAPGAGG
jgi:signal transduction histidine kinase